MRYYGFDSQLSETGPGFVFGQENSNASEIIKLGRLTEYGPAFDVYMDISLEKVLAVFGKRGQGKSYTLGSIIEGLVTQSSNSTISTLCERRALLLFDTLNIYQWMGIPLAEKYWADYPEIRAQAETLQEWALKPEQLDVKVWCPAGFAEGVTSSHHSEFHLRVSDFCLDDWGLVLGLDTVRDIKGQLLAEVYMKVTVVGWDHKDGVRVDAKPEYALLDLVTCMDDDLELQQGSVYHKETIRAVRQQLLAFSRLDLFQGPGTALCELLRPGQASVMLLNKLPQDLRGVLVSVLVRRLLRERAAASEAKKNMLVNPELTENERASLGEFLKGAVPKTWVVIDEAQNVIPAERKTSASESIVKLVKEGRNFGLSFAVTTQQPKALDRAVMSQVETFVIHKLVSSADVEYVLENIKSPFPSEIKEDIRLLSPRELLLDIQRGQAVISDTNTPRAFALQIRPRVSVHGGFEA